MHDDTTGDESGVHTAAGPQAVAAWGADAAKYAHELQLGECYELRIASHPHSITKVTEQDRKYIYAREAGHKWRLKLGQYIVLTPISSPVSRTPTGPEVVATDDKQFCWYWRSSDWKLYEEDQRQLLEDAYQAYLSASGSGGAANPKFTLLTRSRQGPYVVDFSAMKQAPQSSPRKTRDVRRIERESIKSQPRPIHSTPFGDGARPRASPTAHRPRLRTPTVPKTLLPKATEAAHNISRDTPEPWTVHAVVKAVSTQHSGARIHFSW